MKDLFRSEKGLNFAITIAMMDHVFKFYYDPMSQY